MTDTKALAEYAQQQQLGLNFPNDEQYKLLTQLTI